MTDERNEFLLDNIKNRVRIKFCSDKLEFLWAKYLTFLNMITGFTGATLLLFFNSIKLSELDKYEKTNYIIIAMIFALFSLLASVIWRMVSQHFMEIEIFGSSTDIQKYYDICNIQNVTSTHLNHKIRPFYRSIYKIAPVITCLSLLVSWGFILIFIMMNTKDHLEKIF